MRVTADCPCWCPELAEEVIREHKRGKLEYTSNVIKELDGFDAEIFSTRLLYETEKEATEHYDRQHVTPYMRRYYTSGYVDHVSRVGKLKLSVDTQEDFDRVYYILKYVKDYSWQETIHYGNHPFEGRAVAARVND